jgi:hypothetical protein
MFSTLTRQPIARAEFLHQSRSIPQGRRWRFWLGRAITVFVYALTGIMVASEILFMFRVGVETDTFISGPSDWVLALYLLPVITALTMHFRRMFQTLALSANSIARERQANNWDTLVLTGVDARKIVRGKWWATVRHQWRPYVALGILRALLVVWYSANTSRYYLYYGNHGSVEPVLLANALLQLLLAGLAVFVFTLANLFFTAACGVTAFNKRSAVALARAVVTRIGLIFGICLIGFFSLRFLPYYIYASVINPLDIVVSSLATLFDNGIILGGEIATAQRANGFSYYYGPSVDRLFSVFIPSAIVALLIYALLTFLLLRFAQWQAVRQNALPPLSIPGRKLIAIK